MTRQLQHKSMFAVQRRQLTLHTWSDTRLRSQIAHLRHKLAQAQSWHDEEMENVIGEMMHGDWVVGERTIDMGGIFYASIATRALAEAIRRLEAEQETRKLAAEEVEESRKELPDAL